MATTELKSTGLVLEEASAPTPESNTGVLYVKADGELYFASVGGSGGTISETQVNDQASSAVISASTGIYTPQIGVSGDDDLIALAANTASINGDLFLAAGARILMADNDADALTIGQGANDYLVFSSVDDEETISVQKELYMENGDVTFKEGMKITFWGDNEAAASGTLKMSGASMLMSGGHGAGLILTGALSMSAKLTVGGAISGSSVLHCPVLSASTKITTNRIHSIGNSAYYVDLEASAQHTLSGAASTNWAVPVLSCSTKIITKQIGPVADAHLLALSDGVLSGAAGAQLQFNILSASTKIITSQIGPVGDAHLISLSDGVISGAASSKLQVPVITASSNIVTPMIGRGGDTDLLNLQSGKLAVSGTVSGTLCNMTAISASLGLYTPQIGLSADDDLMGLASGELTVNGGLTVTGDMTVAGTTSVVNSTNLHVKDPLVLLNSGNVTIGNDIGIIFQRSDSTGTAGSENRASKGFIWDESADVFAVIACNAESGTSAGNVTISSYAPFVAGTLSGTTATLTAISASVGLYTPQIGVSADRDLLTLASGKLTVAGAVSSSTGFYVATGGHIGVAGDEDLLSLTPAFFHVSGTLMGAMVSGTTSTFTMLSASQGVYAPQIGVSGDDDLMALSSGLLTVNGQVSASGFYATQIGLSGDDDLLTLASAKLTVAGAMTASTVHSTAQVSGTLGFFTAASCSLGIYTPQIGLSGDDDLMTLTAGTVTVAGTVAATTLSGATGTFPALSASSVIRLNTGSMKITHKTDYAGRTAGGASLSGATADAAFTCIISSSKQPFTQPEYFMVGMSSSYHGNVIGTNMLMAWFPNHISGTAAATPIFKIQQAWMDNLTPGGVSPGSSKSDTMVISASKGVTIYGRANDDGYHLELPNTASARAMSWATYSSKKYKKNIMEMNTADALERVMTMRGVNYTWNTGGDRHDVGFIAEEMVNVVPEVVKLDANGEATSIDYSRLTSVIVEAMKEQQHQIEDLKQTIVQLQNGKRVKAKVGRIKLKDKTSSTHQEIDAPELYLDSDGVWQKKS